MILKPDKDATDTKSYRPISLLPIVGKIFERIMTKRITAYMISKALINKYQYGFQKNKSCVHQVLRMSEHINRWFNTKPSGRTLAVLIYAAKAFDCVWHDGLRQMFMNDKFPAILIRFLSSWLSQRTCRVRINTDLSNFAILSAGVPQGSLLSPIIYIYFTRNMPTKATNEMFSSFYADDTAYAASDAPHARRRTFAGENLQEILLTLEHFCNKWRIGLNASKTKLILFKIRKNQNTEPNIYLKNELLKYEDNAKFLGVTFDKELSFKSHIEDIVNRSKKKLHSLCGEFTLYNITPSTL